MQISGKIGNNILTVAATMTILFAFGAVAHANVKATPLSIYFGSQSVGSTSAIYWSMETNSAFLLPWPSFSYSGPSLPVNTTSTIFTAQNNWVHDTDGIAINAHGGTNNYTIRGNKLEYISIKRDGSVWYGNPAVAVYNDGGNTGVMERNFVDHAGVGFEALSEPGQPATHDVTIRNNVVQNSQTGIVLGTWYSDTDGSSIYNIRVLNNTFYANTEGVHIRPMTSASVSWENNIFSNNTANYVNTLSWPVGTSNYNLWFSGGTGPGSNSVTLNPLFNNASTADFSLQPTSPAINAGDPSTSATVVGAVDFAGNPRILGGRIDIGAYEYGSGGGATQPQPPTGITAIVQ